MKIHIYHHHIDSDNYVIFKKLDNILTILKAVQRKEGHMSIELDALQVAVDENTSLDDSIILLVSGLAAQIEALKDDPAKLQAMADILKIKSAAIAAAIKANTPAEPPV